jgi:SAM-dependent methyltransferase
VIGVSIKESEVRHNRQLFNEFLGIPEDRLKFTVHNLYALSELGLQFDEVICSEVLEHIRRDREMIKSFAGALKPGGVLHLCCPNAEHPDNAASPLDPDEKGGHVRPGYTLESYRQILEPEGFRIVESAGLGGPVRQAFNKRMIRIQERAGFLPGFALFIVSLGLVWLDPAAPKVPYSIYVRAVKEGP